ncbi:MAG TPA: ABC transporter permease [Syntrophomonadaceae bacterium]|nr:ABC transporter permease [Syntrophomonadaceae bacterium]
MSCEEPGALPNASVKTPSLAAALLHWLKVWSRGVTAIVEMEVRKIMHDPTEILTRGLQPIFWLLIFGQAFGRVRAFPTGDIPYQVFITPGILAQSMMFISIFFGISIIWERDLGLLQKLLVLPLPRSVFVVGKSLSAGFRSLTQVAMVMLLAIVIGIPLRLGFLSLIGVVLSIVAGAMFFSSFSMVMACLLKTRERFMGFGQLFTMPFFFTSNALYPISIMPAWLQSLARINPLTYVVDLLRGLLVGTQVDLIHASIILIVDVVIITIVASFLYPRAIQ